MPACQFCLADKLNEPLKKHLQLKYFSFRKAKWRLCDNLKTYKFRKVIWISIQTKVIISATLLYKNKSRCPASFWFVVIQRTDSAAAAAAATEKMIMVCNQGLFWCNGVPTKHDKALKWIQSLRGNIPS